MTRPNRYPEICLLLVLASGAGCSPSHEPSAAAMQLLPGTHSRYTLIGGAFSVAADERHLFTTDYDPTRHPVREGEAIRRSFVFDLATLQRQDIAWTEAATRAIANGVLEEAGCWQGSRLFVSTFPPRGIAVDLEQPPLAWQPVAEVPCARFEITPPTQVLLTRQADGAVTLEDRVTRTEFFRADPIFPGGTAVLLEELQLDPSGRWLAFRVTRPRGSFSGNSAAYLLDLQAAGATPELLASPARSLRFVGNSLLLQARVGAERGNDWVLLRRLLP